MSFFLKDVVTQASDLAPSWLQMRLLTLDCLQGVLF